MYTEGQIVTIAGKQYRVSFVKGPVNPRRQWDAAIAAERAKGLSHSEAVIAARRAHPDLVDRLDAYAAREARQAQQAARERRDAAIYCQIEAMRRKG